MYVCMYVRTYAHTHMHIHTHKHTHAHFDIHKVIDILEAYTYICIHVHARTYHTSVRIHICLHSLIHSDDEAETRSTHQMHTNVMQNVTRARDVLVVICREEERRSSQMHTKSDAKSNMSTDMRLMIRRGEQIHTKCGAKRCGCVCVCVSMKK